MAGEPGYHGARDGGGQLKRQRVIAYVTRERQGQRELLVFDHRDEPDAGTQLPAGRLDEGESLEDGLLREMREETGLDGGRIVRALGSIQTTYESDYDNHAFEVAVDRETPGTWEHTVHGDGDDAGLVFACRWVPLDPELRLFGDRDPLLAELLQREPRG